MKEQFGQMVGQVSSSPPRDAMGLCEDALGELENVMATLEKAACSVMSPAAPENATPQAVSEIRKQGSPVTEQAIQFCNRIKKVRDLAASIRRRIDL